MKIDLLLLIAGKSERFRSDKQNYIFSNGMKMWQIIINNILDIFKINKIIIVHNDNTLPIIDKQQTKLIWVKGSTLRSDSVRKALAFVKTEKVIIHDGARPFLSNKSWIKFIDKCEKSESLISAVRIVNSVKQILSFSKNNYPLKIRTVNRSNFITTETPQMFKTVALKNAYKNIKKKIDFVDEVELLEYSSKNNELIFNFFFHSKPNPKITYLQDIRTYNALLWEKN